MATHDLGGGVRVSDLQINPSFPGGAPSASLLVPDPLFNDIKGSLRYSAGTNPQAKTVGQTAMGATATLTIPGSNFAVGFKQVVFFRFHTLLYAGRKDSDGCIEETSTGLNFRFLLDCAASENLQSPWAPFYLPRKIAPTGRSTTIEMPDQPAGKARLQRRNDKRDRLNFLLAFRQSCRFVTCVVVENTKGAHVPLEGFEWSYSHEIDIAWTSGEPSIARNQGTCRFDSRIPDLKARRAELDLFADATLSGSDTIVTKFNQAMFTTLRGGSSGDYAITPFDNYTENITPQLQGLLPSA